LKDTKSNLVYQRPKNVRYLKCSFTTLRRR